MLSLNTSALSAKPISYLPAGQLSGTLYVRVNTVPPSSATIPSPSSPLLMKLRPGRSRLLEIVALSRQLAVSPIAVIVIGESCLNTTSIEMIAFPFAVSLTGTFTSSPGAAIQLPKSNTISPVGVGVGSSFLVVVVTGLLEVVVTSSLPPDTVIYPFTFEIG